MKLEHEFTKKSMMSGKMHSVKMMVDMDDYAAWQNGQLIQNAMPYLSPDEREFLMTGITKEEWNTMFPPEAANDEGVDPHGR